MKASRLDYFVVVKQVGEQSYVVKNCKSKEEAKKKLRNNCLDCEAITFEIEKTYWSTMKAFA